jgi:hypothetical protein
MLCQAPPPSHDPCYPPGVLSCIRQRTALQESYTDSLGPRSPLDPGEKIYPAHTRQKTFSRFIEVETWKHPELAAIQPVMKGIESACKGIARLVRRAQCDDISGEHSTSMTVSWRRGDSLEDTVESLPPSAPSSHLPLERFPELSFRYHTRQACTGTGR